MDCLPEIVQNAMETFTPLIYNNFAVEIIHHNDGEILSFSLSFKDIRALITGSRYRDRDMKSINSIINNDNESNYLAELIELYPKLFTDLTISRKLTTDEYLQISKLELNKLDIRYHDFDNCDNLYELSLEYGPLTAKELNISINNYKYPNLNFVRTNIINLIRPCDSSSLNYYYSNYCRLLITNQQSIPGDITITRDNFPNAKIAIYRMSTSADYSIIDDCAVTDFQIIKLDKLKESFKKLPILNMLGIKSARN